MRLSRSGIFLIVIFAVLSSAGCGYYNQVIMRKNLVDGSNAYKNRKFQEAEQLFRYAASKDPSGDTLEGRTAQLSLARTLHSEYIGNRSEKGKAEEALNEYKKALPQALKDLKAAQSGATSNNADEQRRYLNSLTAVNSTASAIASLYENIEQPDKAREWQMEVANNADYPETARARALSSLGAKFNTCANDITDTEQTKKTIKQNGKDVFQFVKPTNPEDFAKLNDCVAQGTKLIEQASSLEPDSVKNAANLNVQTLSDVQLALYSEIFKVFESIRSYKASLLIQAMRAAEMDGRNADRDRLKQEAEEAKNQFSQLSDVVRKMQVEMDARTAAKEEAEKGANANAKK
jgi:hypothetical protein